MEASSPHFRFASMPATTFMKNTIKVLLIGTSLLALWMPKSASGFYHPVLQRWINRDPIGESADINLSRFVANNGIGNRDTFGLQCCLLIYQSRTWNHSAIECNGVYISGFPSSGMMLGKTPVEWHDKAKYEYNYGKAVKRICFDCIKDESVAQWFTGYKASSPKFCGPDNNCSDIARQAITASLSKDQEKKPDCPSVCAPFRYIQRDLLSPQGISSPSELAAQVEDWKMNDCKRYKCDLYDPPKGMR